MAAPRRASEGARPSTLVLQIGVLLAIVAALAAHVAVSWTVLGAIDSVVFAVDGAFALLALVASALHLQQLGSDRRRQQLVQSLARTLSSPRDVDDTALAAANLLVEAGVADAAVVGVAKTPATVDERHGDGTLLAVLARVGFPAAASVAMDERPAQSFLTPTVAREALDGDPWLVGLAAVGTRPVVARVPLRRGGELLGGLLLVSRHPGTLSDRLLLGTVATMVGTALDNARLYEATLDQARDLEAQDARRREFLYAISHELRTPLTSIRAFAELLTEERASKRGRRVQPPEEEELLQSLSRGVDRLSDLVEDLLQLGQSEEVAERTDLTTIDATAQLRAAESIIRPSFMRRQQALQMVVPAQPVWVLGDARALEQVLINLLSNANRHSPEGGLITASVAVDGVVARFEVSDSGPGVPPEERTRIFEPFYRVRHAGTQVPGSGLGLAIARRGVEQLNGRIWVEEGTSTDPAGPGARFCVEVPLAALDRVPPDPGGSEPPVRSRPAPRALKEAVDDATQLHLELQQRE